MFRGYVNLPDSAGASNPEQRTLELLTVDPLAAALLMEYAWQVGGRGTHTVTPLAKPSSATPDGTPSWYSLGLGNDLRDLVKGVNYRHESGQLMWDHLIYAYLVENTRIFEIFHRVLWELAHGERIGIPVEHDTFRWWRTTEELFYKDASPFQARSQVSRIRPDIRASRREWYYRFFGIDLNHGNDSGGAYPYEKAEASNRDFVPTLEEFLREVWIGIQFAPSQVGSNPTDDAAIANLALRLQNMLIARRGNRFGGLMLAREEFNAVATMAWLHLTVQYDTPIVRDLRATAPSPEERLRLIGERVGLPAHARSHSYFMLAPALSTLLTELEAGLYSSAAAAPNLYARLTASGDNNPIRRMMMIVITHWSMITGRDLKATRVGVGPAAPGSRMDTPTAMPAIAAPTPTAFVSSTTSPATAGNGRGPVEHGSAR